jgi:hypothetical protein
MGLPPTERLPTDFQLALRQVDVDGALYPYLVLRLDPAAANLTWTVQESSDLVDWVPATTAFAAPIDHPDGTRTWSLRSQTNLQSGPVFLRLSLYLSE